ncbi:YraN family protein [Clostridium sp.]|uniref:YraN family protein n=1 Tax=Clostridium sp. TaxID=1506 RepID=UPI002608F3FA|nr:YraN family protein [Clostridium sp.]
MKNLNKAIGSYGEKISKDYLINNGYIILDLNYRSRYGEIDIICKLKDIIVFIEVKSRYNTLYGLPQESVTYFKQRRILNLCNYYIISKNLFNYNCRFDVIEVYFNTINNDFKINHLKDSFRGY